VVIINPQRPASRASAGRYCTLWWPSTTSIWSGEPVKCVPMTLLPNIDGALPNALRSRGMPQHQMVFLQQVLTASGSPLLITELASAAPTATHAVRWADTVLRQRHASGGAQPYLSYATSAHRTAVDACESLPGISCLPIAVTWLKRLHCAPPAILTGVVREDEWRTHVIQVLNHAFGQPAAAEWAMRRWGLEVAAALTEEQRSPARLVGEIIAALGREVNRGVDVQAIITRLLITPDRQHVALLGVNGARRLLQLDSMGSTGALRQVFPGQQHQFSGWGALGSQASEFALGLAAGRADLGEAALRSTGPHAFVSVEVKAPDTNAALERARVTLDEALDQYIVAHPTVDLKIDPVAAVAAPDEAGSFTIQDSRRARVAELTPLVVAWPDALLIGLRMANLMRSSPAPLTGSSR